MPRWVFSEIENATLRNLSTLKKQKECNNFLNKSHGIMRQHYLLYLYVSIIIFLIPRHVTWTEKIEETRDVGVICFVA